MSTYSPSLRVELITQGDQAGQWGTTTNDNFSYIFDAAIAGYQTVSVTSASQAFTHNNGPVSTASLNQSVYAMLRLTTTTGATFAVYAPPNSKQYIIWNNSGYAATIYNSTVIGNTTAAGLGVTIADGDRLVVFSDGTNFYEVKSTNVTGVVAIANGGTGQSTQQTAINALAGAVTSGSYLRGNGTNVVMSTIQAADLPTATDSANGAIKLGSGTAQSVAANAVTATTSRSYALQLNASGQGVVNVPWSDTVYTLPAATSTVRGGIELGSDTVQSVAANAVTTTTSRTYALQVNGDGQGVVNVPWTTTSPSGSNTQIQYNNAGAFGGSVNFVFDGTNVGIGTSTPATYGKFVVNGAASLASALVSTSATLTDKATLDFRKTANTASVGIVDNSIGRISFYSQQGSTTIESAYISARDYRISGVSLPEIKLATYNSTVSSETNRVSLGYNGITMYTGNSAGMVFEAPIYTFNDAGGNFTVTAAAVFSGSLDVSVGGLTVASVPVVTTTGTQTLSNKTLASNTIATTQTSTDNSTKVATTAFVQAALQALHPVGSIYINATNATNPGTLLGFGTWTAFGAGRVPVGFNASNPLFDTAEETGGSADAVVVSHTHSVTDPGHAHTYSLTGYTNYSNGGVDPVGRFESTANTGSATTGLTINSTGSSGTNANYQPYITVYMWKRTA
jgi:hypothetical protein